jgi:NADPH-dependent 2,4-dienoyl-CoA reductase/sulfur reductase-like enzyme
MESTRYLLVGGGVASLAAATAIRKRDAEGRVLIVGCEEHPPYDRPPLSKQMLVNDDFKIDDPYSKFDNYYPDNNIDLLKGVKVTSIDRATKVARCDNGTEIAFEKLLLAMGGDIRRLDIPGGDLPELHYLRYMETSLAIRESLKSSRSAIVIGSSYMGMEVASGCVVRGLDTTIVSPDQHPWGKFASPGLGQFMREQYEKAGAKFALGEEVAEISPAESLQVMTKSGQTFSADVVIACVGAKLNARMAKEWGFDVDDKHGVVVDETLRTSDPSVWAAGDLACFQDVAMGKRWHAEHFLNAKWQGERAGANMAGENEPYDQVPYFFSDFLDLHMILRGDPQGGKNTTVLGDMGARHFAELYSDDEGVLKMGVAISHDESTLDPISDKFEALIRAKALASSVSAADLGV